MKEIPPYTIHIVFIINSIQTRWNFNKKKFQYFTKNIRLKIHDTFAAVFFEMRRRAWKPPSSTAIIREGSSFSADNAAIN